MVTITSDTEPKQDLKDALIANGLTVNEPAKTEEPVKPVDDKSKSEPEGAPGETIPAETKGEAPATTEVVEDKSQGTPQGEQPKPIEKEKAKGGFQAKIDKLTAKAEALVEQLEEERGSKTVLQKQLDAVQAELAALKPAEVKADEGPVRPKRPKLSDVDFDQDKYDTLVDKYEGELDAYYAAVADNKAKEAVSGYEQTAAQARHQAEWLGRINEDKKDIPGYDDLIAALPDESVNPIKIPQVIAAYSEHKSKHPGHISAFLAKDYLENDGAELARLSKLDEFDQLIEIKAIEDRLVSEAKAAKKSATKEAEPKAAKVETKPVEPAPAAEKKPEVVPPVKEQPKAKALDEDDAPITAVGTRATGRPETMAELAERAASGDKEARKLLNEAVGQVQYAKHGGR